MKIEQQKQEFTPVVITLESASEFDEYWNVFSWMAANGNESGAELLTVDFAKDMSRRCRDLQSKTNTN